MFDKRFKNLILCSNLNSDSGISASSDFASCNKDTYLTFILHCWTFCKIGYVKFKEGIK